MLMRWESGSVWQSDILRSEVWEVQQENSSRWRTCSRRQEEPFPLLSAGTGERFSARAEIRAGRSASAELPGWPRGWFTWERWMDGTGQGLQASRWWMGQTLEKMGGEGGWGMGWLPALSARTIPSFFFCCFFFFPSECQAVNGALMSRLFFSFSLQEKS